MSARFSAVPALVAAGAILAAPLQAAPVAPVAGEPLAAVAAAEGGTSYHRYYRYRRGPDLGDVLAGVLIVGGIAVAADAAAKAVREDRYRDRAPYPQDDRRYDTRRYDDRRGIDRAVDMCVDAIERDSRVETVDRVDRTAGGWRVAGSVKGGKPFTCSLGSDGRIEAVEVEGRRVEVGAPYRMGGDYRDERGGPRYGEDRQYGHDRYAEAWSRHDAEDREGDRAEDQRTIEMDEGAVAPAPETDGPQPAYPGGPLPGEESQDMAPTTEA